MRMQATYEVIVRMEILLRIKDTNEDLVKMKAIIERILKREAITRMEDEG